jgi:hypothetical protein
VAKVGSREGISWLLTIIKGSVDNFNKIFIKNFVYVAADASACRCDDFVRNHAQAIVACDFCTVVTATFRLLYVFVLMEHATRRILHANVTAHPTAQWTIQQLRNAMLTDHGYRFLIHDRDCIFSQMG